MKWYFFYTPNYHFYKNKIIKSLNDSKFEINPLEILPFKLSEAGENKHHFDNITIKIELLINCIKENMNNKILFTDATIYINPNKTDELYSYLNKITCDGEVDIALVPYNIGFMLLNCNNKTLNFWEKVLEIMKKKMDLGEKVHDQSLAVQLFLNEIDEYKCNLNVAEFDPKIIFISNHLGDDVKNKYLVFKMTCDLALVPSGVTTHQQRLKMLYDAQAINYDEYLININDEKYNWKN
jgi:hypothetical protein